MSSFTSHMRAGGRSIYQLARMAAKPDVPVLYDPENDTAQILHPTCVMLLKYRHFGDVYVLEPLNRSLVKRGFDGTVEIRPGFFAQQVVCELRSAIEHLPTELDLSTDTGDEFDPVLTAFRRACGRMLRSGHVPARFRRTVDLSRCHCVFLTTASPVHTLNLLT